MLENNAIYKISPLLKDKMSMGVEESETGNNTPVNIKDSSNIPSQQWKIVKVDEDVYYLEPQHALGKALARKVDDTAPGPQIIISDYNPDLTNQQWKIVYEEENAYLLLPVGRENIALGFSGPNGVFQVKDGTLLELQKLRDPQNLGETSISQIWRFIL